MVLQHCGGFRLVGDKPEHFLESKTFRANIDAMKALAAHRAELRELASRYDVKNPRIFGSVLTGSDDEESDLDLLVDATDTTSLFTLGGLQDEAQELLGIPVHVSTPGNLSPKYRQRVLDQAEDL
jgi:predicted nucleotidyltransferase